MSNIEDEIDANRIAFFERWTGEATRNWEALKTNSHFAQSYRRITVLQAIKAHLIAPRHAANSAEFFFEAHNDTLISHVNASIGAWRPALQALRSSIENTLCAVYYNEHPIELEKWAAGNFSMPVSKIFDYLQEHPRLLPFGEKVSGLSILRAEYATLSKAVHGSSVNFRMTDSVSTVLLWNTDQIKASMWATRERKTIEGICLLLVCLHSEALQGSSLTPLRDVLHLGISSTSARELKMIAGINIVAEGGINEANA